MYGRAQVGTKMGRVLFHILIMSLQVRHMCSQAIDSQSFSVFRCHSFTNSQVCPFWISTPNWMTHDPVDSTQYFFQCIFSVRRKSCVISLYHQLSVFRLYSISGGGSSKYTLTWQFEFQFCFSLSPCQKECKITLSDEKSSIQIFYYFVSLLNQK